MRDKVAMRGDASARSLRLQRPGRGRARGGKAEADLEYTTSCIDCILAAYALLMCTAQAQTRRDSHLAPSKYTARDLVFIALMAAAGIAIKPLIVPVIRVVAVPLGLPGGSLVGGIYMMWLILGHAFTGRPWAATLVGVVQAILAWAMGIPGPQGPWTLVMYMAPGMAADLVLRLSPGSAGATTLSPGVAMLAGAAANVAGIALMCVIIYRISFPVLVLSMAVGALSGAIGGVLAYAIHRRVSQIARQTHGG